MDKHRCKKSGGYLPGNGNEGIDKRIYKGNPEVLVAKHFTVILKACKGLVQHGPEIPVEEAHEKEAYNGIDREKAEDAKAGEKQQ